MLTLKGKVQKFDLTGESNRGRSYITVDTNFGTLERYFKVSVYDVATRSGEQREPIQRRVNYLKKQISNERYTPDVFQASIATVDQLKFDDKGNVQVTLDENAKLALLNGLQRFTALKQIKNDSSDTTVSRKIDNLPIPMLLYLQPEKRKMDFANLNNDQPVSRSHLLNIRIDEGLVDPKKQKFLETARNIAIAVNKDDVGPFYRMVSFGGNESVAPLSLSALASDRKGDGIMTLFYTARLLRNMEATPDSFYENLNYIYAAIKNHTSAADIGNLLCVPPEGPRGAANLLIGVVNQWMYYLYLHQRNKPTAKDIEVLQAALTEFESPVDGDLSSKRRKTLMKNFAQTLFQSISEDDDSNIACHFGIPISLLVTVGNSCFDVDAPPKALGSTEFDNELGEEVSESKMSSDTDPEFLK
jgi:hypothetical protein